MSLVMGFLKPHLYIQHNIKIGQWLTNLKQNKCMMDIKKQTTIWNNKLMQQKTKINP